MSQGLTVFFTGLCGSGKSSLANLLSLWLEKLDGRHVTVLDGDVVRLQRSPELGFSKEDRDINIRRLGSIASQVTQSGGIALCAAIAPYDAARKKVRAMIEPLGSFALVHVATPLAVCEARDPKGLYAKARAGLIGSFTGISDPYEVPQDAEIVIDTSMLTLDDAANYLVDCLRERRFLGPAGAPGRLRATEPVVE